MSMLSYGVSMATLDDGGFSSARSRGGNGEPGGAHGGVTISSVCFPYVSFRASSRWCGAGASAPRSLAPLPFAIARQPRATSKRNVARYSVSDQARSRPRLMKNTALEPPSHSSLLVDVLVVATIGHAVGPLRKVEHDDVGATAKCAWASLA